jgi:hypothetical protein
VIQFFSPYRLQRSCLLNLNLVQKGYLIIELEQTKSLEKKYKKVMDRCIRKHRKKMKQKIHNLRSTNPKEYWKIINSG